MDKFFILKCDKRLLVVSIMNCPENEAVCLECNTESELYELIKKMDCQISFTQPYNWNVAQPLIRNEGKKDFLFVKMGAYFKRIDMKEIKWIEAAGSYSSLIMNDSKRILLSFNLTEISSFLPKYDFIRVHRSYMVNIDFVESFIGNMLRIGDKEIPISKTHKNDVLRCLNLLE